MTLYNLIVNNVIVNNYIIFYYLFVYNLQKKHAFTKCRQSVEQELKLLLSYIFLSITQQSTDLTITRFFNTQQSSDLRPTLVSISVRLLKIRIPGHFIFERRKKILIFKDNFQLILINVMTNSGSLSQRGSSSTERPQLMLYGDTFTSVFAWRR